MELPLGQTDTVSIIDEADLEIVTQAGPWTLIEWRSRKYAKRRVREDDDPYPAYATISLHTFLTGFDYTDHINGDGLDNRRENLRRSTHAQNLQNQGVQQRSRSGYRGVTYFPNAGQYLRKKPWRARIKIDGDDITIGYYETREEAALVWNRVAREAWGEYAFQNVIINSAEERR